MGFLDSLASMTDGICNLTSKVGDMFDSTTKNETATIEKNEIAPIVKNEEMPSVQTPDGLDAKVTLAMNWAFDVANGNIPGLGTSHEMAQRYLDKYGSVSSAVDHLVFWQIAAAATTGFVTGLGGIATMPLLLPANLAGVTVIQLRMVGAIAEMGGYEEKSEDKKTGMYLCLLGSQAGSALSKTTNQFSVKFATASLKKLPGSVLTKINKAVGFKLVTKFGEKGLINLAKAIPVLGGVIGGTVDAFSTYAIAKTAKALFLDDAIDFEQQERIEVDKMRLLMNMAIIDGEYDEKEAGLLKMIAGSLNISEKSQAMLASEIDNPKMQKVDLSQFKGDKVNSTSLISGLSQMAKYDGKIEPIEKMYISSIASELGYPELVADL